jgi:hypothetical protein
MFGTILERVRMPIGVAGSAGPARGVRFLCASRRGEFGSASLRCLVGRSTRPPDTARLLTWLAQQLPRTTPIGIDILPALDSSREVIISTSIRIAVMASTILSNPVGGSHTYTARCGSRTRRSGGRASCERRRIRRRQTACPIGARSQAGPCSSSNGPRRHALSHGDKAPV